MSKQKSCFHYARVMVFFLMCANFQTSMHFCLCMCCNLLHLIICLPLPGNMQYTFLSLYKSPLPKTMSGICLVFEKQWLWD